MTLHVKNDKKTNYNFMGTVEREEAIADARDAVIEAALDFDATCSEESSANLHLSCANLRKLEQPPDPLEPVREFVRIADSWGPPRHTKNEYNDALIAAAKALGMEVENK